MRDITDFAKAVGVAVPAAFCVFWGVLLRCLLGGVKLALRLLLGGCRSVARCVGEAEAQNASVRCPGAATILLWPSLCGLLLALRCD